MALALASVAAALGAHARRFDIDVLDRCDSTNAVLLDRAERGAPSGTVVAAREQTAGRGRRGRTWVSAPDDSLTFSLLWRFPAGTAPAGLSLAVGVAVARAVTKVGAGETVRLKWPNDVLLDGRKLGGILVELVPGAPHAAVIGIGLNLRLPEAMPAELRPQAAALAERGGVDANTLLAAVLAELLDVLDAFAAAGFAALREEWQSRQAWPDRPVRLSSDFAPPRDGLCRGVDTDGALLLDVDGRVERVLSGEVSLRPLTP